jgi:hypothetical protein
VDNAGLSMEQEIAQHLARFYAQRQRLLDEFPEGWFSFGEVRHDPPWHMLRGRWQGPWEVRRGDHHLNVSLCSKELGRGKKDAPRAEEDICDNCLIRAVIMYRRRR